MRPPTLGNPIETKIAWACIRNAWLFRDSPGIRRDGNQCWLLVGYRSEWYFNRILSCFRPLREARNAIWATTLFQLRETLQEVEPSNTVKGAAP